jgi:hypothetical protein
MGGRLIDSVYAIPGPQPTGWQMSGKENPYQPKIEIAAQMIAAQSPALRPMIVTRRSQIGHFPSV